MTRELYSAHLEKRLIEDFKKKFMEKLGYEPLVLTKVKHGKHLLPILTLEELEECFDPYLPERGGITLRLNSKCRKRELVELRNIFCYLAKSMGYVLTDIGQFLGNRDHTTVIHNINTFKDLIETNEMFKYKFEEILIYIKSKHESSDLEQFDQAPVESEPALLP